MLLLLGNIYNIPIQVWLLSSHPYNAPLVYVRPTNNMMIKPSKHVDHAGRVYLPYLSEWKMVGSITYLFVNPVQITSNLVLTVTIWSDSVKYLGTMAKIIFEESSC